MPGSSDIKRIQNFVNRIKSLYLEAGVKWKIQDIGLSRSSFEKNLDMMTQYMLENVGEIRSIRPFNRKRFKKMFRYAYEGRDIDF